MSDALINGLAGAGGGSLHSSSHTPSKLYFPPRIFPPFRTFPSCLWLSSDFSFCVNTRQQTDRGRGKTGFRDGTVAQMYQVVQQEGWQRLYGGLAPSMFGTAASQGVYYYFYQIFRSRAEKAALDKWKRGSGDGSVGMLQSLVAAALSGCMNVLLTNPIWVIVTRMQSKRIQSDPSVPDVLNVKIQTAAIEKPSYGTSHTVHEIYDEAGVFGFWKGVFPALIMVSNPSIQFMLYETLLKKLKARRAAKGSNAVTALEFFLLGAIAKLGATVATYPLLVVKSRLQAKQVVSSDKNHHYRGTADAITKMIYHEGLSVFYKGMSTKIMQSVLAAAVLFMVKEELVKGARLLVTGDLGLTGGGSSRSKSQ
ncbi:unnamed protein product [Spirodela intermedia]|uniref:Uncharacterized protein n=1 Tax=Spirodela intermedia TaxID=51605 RepID=A0A7I8IC06_SPIIN|nr:unnamed protein product [Spirodela intermedia]CAA6655110.1 unnamed protein product [Spirodela intermedia]